MKQTTAYLLENRGEVIKKAIEMLQTPDLRTLVLIGHRGGWLEDASFLNTLQNIRKQQEIEVICWLTKPHELNRTVRDYLKLLKSTEIIDKVVVKKYGNLRVCLVNEYKILLAFSENYEEPERRTRSEYGIYLEDARFGRWLWQRCMCHTDRMPDYFENKVVKRFKEFCIWFNEHWVEILIAFILGLLTNYIFSLFFSKGNPFLSR